MTESGLLCEAGDFYIDPMRRVNLALITHAHSDHARRGSQKYICAQPGVSLLQARLGPTAKIEGVPYGEQFRLGEALVSFHPAGHILGSAQIRIEYRDRVWVASGDYKREPDPTCEPFEVVPCDTFITEATFGNPRYQWEPQVDPTREIFDWWQCNRKSDINSVLYCYALGKSQRVLGELLRFTSDTVYIYGETAKLTKCYRDEGVQMVPTRAIEELKSGDELRGELIIAPHAFANSPWINQLGIHETGFASGWMRTGAFGMASRYDRGFVVSDHADWNGLITTIKQTGARRILILHNSDNSLAKYLKGQGLEAAALTKISVARAARPIQGELF